MTNPLPESGRLTPPPTRNGRRRVWLGRFAALLLASVGATLCLIAVPALKAPPIIDRYPLEVMADGELTYAVVNPTATVTIDWKYREAALLGLPVATLIESKASWYPERPNGQAVMRFATGLLRSQPSDTRAIWGRGHFVQRFTADQDTPYRAFRLERGWWLAAVLPMMLAGGATVACWVAGRRRANRRIAAGLCSSCGYGVGSAGRCPECGA
ncbi:MAG TPA: hypothetical protein VEB22_05420 [Phycisphaerales bacterium]|nr:hypothetical protein [Phycisphaerales bacterium]